MALVESALLNNIGAGAWAEFLVTNGPLKESRAPAKNRTSNDLTILLLFAFMKYGKPSKTSRMDGTSIYHHLPRNEIVLLIEQGRDVRAFASGQSTKEIISDQKLLDSLSQIERIGVAFVLFASTRFK